MPVSSLQLLDLVDPSQANVDHTTDCEVVMGPGPTCLDQADIVGGSPAPARSMILSTVRVSAYGFDH